jgi:hypothetical protein
MAVRFLDLLEVIGWLQSNFARFIVSITGQELCFLLPDMMLQLIFGESAIGKLCFVFRVDLKRQCIIV